MSKNIPEQPDFAKYKPTKKEKADAKKLAEARSWNGYLNLAKQGSMDFVEGAVNSIPALTNLAGDVAGFETPVMDSVSGYLRGRRRLPNNPAFDVGEFWGTGAENVAAGIAKRVPSAVSRYSKFVDDNFINGEEINNRVGAFFDEIVESNKLRKLKNERAKQVARDLYASLPPAGMSAWFK